MAINITYSAQSLSPAYNPVEFIFSGNNNTKLGYRYIVEVYDSNNNRISKQKVVPQINGTGKIDISRILSNMVTVSFNPTTNQVNNAANSYFNYRIAVGEEYVPDAWIYTSVSAATYVQTGERATQLNGTSAHTFVTNDEIYVTNSIGYGFVGFRKVLQASPPNTLVLNVGFSDATTGNTSSGTTQYSNGRKFVTLGITPLTGLTVFNGIQTVANFITYSGVNYTIDTISTTDKMLTNLPDNFYATATQDLKLNAYINKVNGQTYAIKWQDNLGATNTVYPIVAAANAKEVVQFNVGYNAMGLSNAANVSWYEVWIVNVTGLVQLSKKYRINLDKRCKIEDYEIAFQDRMGSIASFNFQLRSKETGTINRTQYKQQLATGYSTIDRGTTNIFIEFNKDYEMNTNWITDEMSQYFEELLTSPYTWVKMGGIYYACTVIDAGFETERQKNKRLIRKNIKIRLANNDSVNI